MCPGIVNIGISRLPNMYIRTEKIIFEGIEQGTALEISIGALACRLIYFYGIIDLAI